MLKTFKSAPIIHVLSILDTQIVIQEIDGKFVTVDDLDPRPLFESTLVKLDKVINETAAATDRIKTIYELINVTAKILKDDDTRSLSAGITPREAKAKLEDIMAKDKELLDKFNGAKEELQEFMILCKVVPTVDAVDVIKKAQTTSAVYVASPSVAPSTTPLSPLPPGPGEQLH